MFRFDVGSFQKDHKVWDDRLADRMLLDFEVIMKLSGPKSHTIDFEDVTLLQVTLINAHNTIYNYMKLIATPPRKQNMHLPQQICHPLFPRHDP